MNITTTTLRRYHYECTCGTVGPESFDELWADMEAASHLLPLRLTYEYRHHHTTIIVREIDVETDD